MRLILTRHGETEENKQGIVQGHMPGNLSKEGIEQAEKLTIRLKKEKIDAIFSSDLKRAIDTARIIAKYHQNSKFILTEDLREGNAGSWEGKNKKEIDWDNRPADAETIEQQKARSKKIIDYAYSLYPDKTVLFVAHSGINRAIISVITSKDIKGFESQKNTAVNIFEIKEDGSHTIHLLNCTKHLE